MGAMKPCPTSWCGTGKPHKITVSEIAHEIVDAIRAECRPGAIPTNELKLRAFADAYTLFDVTPSEGLHLRISERVRVLLAQN
jgi:hypothetical protein